jgi:hypothetical protein
MQSLAIMLTAVMAVAPATAAAQMARSAGGRPLDPAVVRASVDRFSREVSATSTPVVAQAPRKGRPKGERLALVAIGTVGGFFAGAYTGYFIDRTIAPCRCDSCDCDMVGFRGVVIGAPLGALVGLIATAYGTR